MKLKVNMSKTKALIFSKRSQNKTLALYFNQTPISYCTSYKYLGVEFDRNCSFSSARKNRILKAQNAVFLLHNDFNTVNSPSIPLASKLFSAKIFPILFYGASIWGPMENLNITYTSVQSITPADVQTLKDTFSKITSKPIIVKSAGKNRYTVLVRTKCSGDKLKLLQSPPNSTIFFHANTTDFYHPAIEAFRNKQSKRLLGISKYRTGSSKQP